MTTPVIEPREFDALRKFIRQVSGITLGDHKQHLLTGRLGPRLRALGLSTYPEYLAILREDRTGTEVRELINCITTNKTSFFREPHHFDALKNEIIPAIAAARAGSPKKLRIWSAACSTGQEPWSLAMTIADALGGSFAGWDVKILASDLDTKVIARAAAATYDETAVADIPAGYRRKYLEPAPNGEFRVIRALRDVVTFRCMNLIQPTTWTLRTKFDAIFCRNVAIYFDRATQELVFTSLAAQLEPNGYLMSGHSENLHWLASTLKAVGNTIHVLAKSSGAARPTVASATVVAVARPAVARGGLVRPAIKQPSHAGVGPFGSASGAMEVAIQVGGIHASAKGAIVKTTLGSCVAACLHDPLARLGGMNHFLLPEDKSGSRGPTNFGIHAMELLITSLMKLGGDRRRFVAKVFGGAVQHVTGPINVGQQNVEFALRYLEEEGIPVVGQRLGGASAMMVVFDTADGKAFVKQIERSKELVNEERFHLASLQAKMGPVEDDIVFFGTP